MSDSESEDEDHQDPLQTFEEIWAVLDQDQTGTLSWADGAILFRLLGMEDGWVNENVPCVLRVDKKASMFKLRLEIRKQRDEVDCLHPTLKHEARVRLKEKEAELKFLELSADSGEAVAAADEKSKEMVEKQVMFDLLFWQPPPEPKDDPTEDQSGPAQAEAAGSPGSAVNDGGEEQEQEVIPHEPRPGIEISSMLPSCQEIFGIFDTDQDGFITREELSVVLRSLGVESSEELFDKILEDFDTNNDGKIQFQELVRFLGTSSDSSAEKLQHHIDALKDLFSLIDVDGDDSFSMSELLSSMAMFGLHPDQEELIQAYEKAGGGFDPAGEEINNDLLCFVRMVVDEPCIGIVKFVESLRDCNELFSLFDDDGGGAISVKELSDTMTALFRRRPTQFEMKRLFETVDDDGSGILEFSEFVHMFYTKHKSRAVAATLEAIKVPVVEQHQLFRIFCTNSVSNFACREFGIAEFRGLMRSLSHPYSEADLQRMMEEIDTSGQGTVDFSEFAKMMTMQVGTGEARTEILRQFRDLRKLFNFFDEDGSGEISTEELVGIVEGLGKHPTQEELTELIRVVDYTNDGDVGFDEFVAMLTNETTPTQVFMHIQIREFRDAYKLFDVDGDQSVSRQEFERVMLLFGESSARDSELLLDIVDSDGDGAIDFVEFLSFMVSKNPILQKNLRSPIVSFREMFNLFDDDGGGSIDFEEFMTMIETLHMKVSAEEVRDMIRSMCGEEADELDFSMFVELIASARTKSGGGGVLGRISELREGFTMFDTDGSGSLDAEEIQEVLQSLGQEMSIEEVRHIVSKVDQDGDGELNFCEFVSLIAGQEQEESSHSRANNKPAHEQLLSVLEGSPVPDPDPQAALPGQVFEHRHDEETAASILSILREQLLVKFFQDVTDSVGLSLATFLKLVTIKPPDRSLPVAKLRPLYRQGRTMTEFNVIISGHVYVYEDSVATDPCKYQLDRHRTDGLWCQLGPVMHGLCTQFRQAVVEMPAEDDSYKFTESTKQMSHDLGYLAKDLFSWHTLGQNTLRCDVDSVLSSESLMEQGIGFLKSANTLLGVVDQVRKEHIALRTKIHLVSAGEQADGEVSENSLAKVETVIRLSKELLQSINNAVRIISPCFETNRCQDKIKSRYTVDQEIYVPSEEEERELVRLHGRYIATLGPGQMFGEAAFATGPEMSWPVTLLSYGSSDLVVARATRQQWQQALLEGPFSFLSSLHIFRSLLLSEIQHMASMMEEHFVSLNTPLQRIGDKATKVFFVKSGTLKIMHALPSVMGQASKSRRRKSLALVGSGDMINECTVVGGVAKYSAEVVADSKNVVVYSMPREAFLNNPRIQANALMISSWREGFRTKRIHDSSRLALPVFDEHNPRKQRLPRVGPSCPPSSPTLAINLATGSSSSVRRPGTSQSSLSHLSTAQNVARPSMSQSSLSLPATSQSSLPRPATSQSLPRPATSQSSLPRSATSQSMPRPATSQSVARPGTSHSSPSVSTAPSIIRPPSPTDSPEGSGTNVADHFSSPTTLRRKTVSVHDMARKGVAFSSNGRKQSFEYVGGRDRSDAIGNLMARERKRYVNSVAGLSQHTALTDVHTAPELSAIKFSYSRVGRPCSVMQPVEDAGPVIPSKVYTLDNSRNQASRAQTTTTSSTISSSSRPTRYNFEVNKDTLFHLRPVRRHGFI